MIAFDRSDQPMLVHVTDLARDAMLTGIGYPDQDWKVLDKVQALSEAGPALVITGADVSDTGARQMLRTIVEAEMRNWVPGASQRLIARATRALGFPADDPRQTDHGPDMGDHVIVADWVADLYVRRCVTCLRLFPDQ